jgi:NADH dehydrogenase
MRSVDVLIAGGGFGGAFCAHRLERHLRGRHERVLLVSPESFLLFSPLLPEAASGTVEPRHCVVPLRSMLPGTEHLAGRIVSIDTSGRRASVEDLNGDTVEVQWRALVLAPGSVPATAPVPGLAEEAVGFKTLADGIWLRNRVLRQLEAADATDDPAARRRLLTFTFVGGGYAGVEALAELESLARDALVGYPRLARADLRWVLVELADSLLPGLSPALASYTLQVLRARGIEVHLGTKMTSCQGGLVALAGESPLEPYPSGTIVWTAGQRPHPVLSDLGLPLDDRGRITVDDHCAALGVDAVWAVGDAAAVPDPANPGRPCPGTAQHGMRQGWTAARNVAAFLGVGRPRAFRYKTRGLAVTLGRNQGTAQVYGRHFEGFIAWWMGRTYHLLMLPGLGRKARLVADWTFALAFPRDVAQLGSLQEQGGRI